MDINFKDIIDRIIESGEKNLDMQGEFLKAVYEIKNRFDKSERDHDDAQKDIDIIRNNTFEIFNKMKLASNESIIEILQDFKKEMDRYKIAMIDLKGCVNTIQDGVNEVKTKDRTIKLIVTALVILFTGIGGFMTYMNAVSMQSIRHEFRKVIQELKNDVKKDATNNY